MSDEADNQRILKAGVEQAQVMGLAGHTQGALWAVVPGIVGAIIGKLSNKFSASTGFFWGALGGVVLSAVQIAMKLFTLANDPEKLDKAQDSRDLHNAILKRVDREVVTENEISGNHTHIPQFD